MAIRRAALELMARNFFSHNGARQDAFRSFLQRNPALGHYAEFRATCDSTQKPWSHWEQRLRHGKLQSGDYDPQTRQYYLYCQWLAQEQVSRFVEFCRSREALFHLDLPVGVHPDSFDTWHHRGLFATGTNVGAPPDLFFSRGQNWGFPPLQPQALRESHYAYVLACLRFQMRHCRILRIDHIMGLHRLYWIPPGFNPSEGVYVKYPAEELYALLSLESHRYQTLMVGENLGTVPPQVNRAMHRHHIRQTYVLQFAYGRNSRCPLKLPPRLSVSSLNTHDTPPFLAHWRGLDIWQRAAGGLIPKADIARERRLRLRQNAALVTFLEDHRLLKKTNSSDYEVLRACLLWLAQSRAEVLMINLEDLWRETRPQNVPGTAGPLNWRRKARLSLEQICHSRWLREALCEIRLLRNR